MVSYRKNRILKRGTPTIGSKEAGGRSPIALFVELISLMTAVGTVATAAMYQFVFAEQGIDYLRIATIGDMFRDGVAFVVVGFGIAFSIVPALLLMPLLVAALYVSDNVDDNPPMWQRGVYLLFSTYILGWVLSKAFTIVNADLAALAPHTDLLTRYVRFGNIEPSSIFYEGYLAAAIPLLLVFELIVIPMRWRSAFAPIIKSVPVRETVALGSVAIITTLTLLVTYENVSRLFLFPAVTVGQSGELEDGLDTMSATCIRTAPAQGLNPGSYSINGRAAWIGEHAIVAQCAAREGQYVAAQTWRVIIAGPQAVEIGQASYR